MELWVGIKILTEKRGKIIIIILTCGATELSPFKQTVLGGPIITAEVLGLIFRVVLVWFKLGGLVKRSGVTVILYAHCFSSVKR